MSNEWKNVLDLESLVLGEVLCSVDKIIIEVHPRYGSDRSSIDINRILDKYEYLPQDFTWTEIKMDFEFPDMYIVFDIVPSVHGIIVKVTQ